MNTCPKSSLQAKIVLSIEYLCSIKEASTSTSSHSNLFLRLKDFAKMCQSGNSARSTPLRSAIFISSHAIYHTCSLSPLAVSIEAALQPGAQPYSTVRHDRLSRTFLWPVLAYSEHDDLGHHALAKAIPFSRGKRMETIGLS